MSAEPNEQWRCLHPRSHGTCNTYNDMDYDSCAACGEDRPAAVAPPSAPKCDCRLYENTVCDICQGVGGKDVAPPETTAPTATEPVVCRHCNMPRAKHRRSIIGRVCPSQASRGALRLFSPAVASSATPTPGTCKHCRHPWGTSSGSIHSDGSGHSSGATRCCHCGEIERYDHKTGPTPPIQHGPFYGEILRYPA